MEDLVVHSYSNRVFLLGRSWGTDLCGSLVELGGSSSPRHIFPLSVYKGSKDLLERNVHLARLMKICPLDESNTYGVWAWDI